jgi:hypothetical protein
LVTVATSPTNPDVVVEDAVAVVDGAGGRVNATTVVVVEVGATVEAVVVGSDSAAVVVVVGSVSCVAATVGAVPVSSESSPRKGPRRTAPRTTTDATLPQRGHRRQAAKPL